MTGGSSGGGWLANVQNGLGTIVSVNSCGSCDTYFQLDAWSYRRSAAFPWYGPYIASGWLK